MAYLNSLLTSTHYGFTSGKINSVKNGGFNNNTHLNGNISKFKPYTSPGVLKHQLLGGKQTNKVEKNCKKFKRHTLNIIISYITITGMVL